jgi:hypothetical protein
LSTDAQRESIINEIDLQLASTVAEEAAQKQRALEEAQKLVGAFPSLSGSPAPESSISPSPSHFPQTHKVMSFKQNNKVVVSAYTPALPAFTPDELEDEPDRILPPPSEPLFSRILPTGNHPWENLIKGASTYIPREHRLDHDNHPQSHGKRNKGSKREIDTEREFQERK